MLAYWLEEAMLPLAMEIMVFQAVRFPLTAWLELMAS